jgi:hypothetical protein
MSEMGIFQQLSTGLSLVRIAEVHERSPVELAQCLKLLKSELFLHQYQGPSSERLG